jgi:hypothetical protein
MSHIKNSNTHSNITFVPVDTEVFKNDGGIQAITNSNGFNYKLKHPVKNVTSMYIDNALFPNTLYNVNNDQVTLYYNIVSNLTANLSDIFNISIIEGFYYCNTSGNFGVIEVHNLLDALNSFNPQYFYFTYGELYNKSFLISVYPTIGAYYYFYKQIGFNSLASDLGFDDIVDGYISVITESINLQPLNTIKIIQGDNDTLIFTKISGIIPTPIVFKPGTYNLYNIASELTLLLINANINTASSPACLYVPDNDKLLIILGNGFIYKFLYSKLAVTLKLWTGTELSGTGSKTNVNFIADHPVDYSAETAPLQLIDYTHIVTTTGTFVPYTSIVTDVNVTPGFYNIAELCNIANTMSGFNTDDTKVEFSYASDSISSPDQKTSYTQLKVKVNIMQDSNYRTINKCGFFKLLGCFDFYRITNPVTTPANTFKFLPSPPKLFTKNIYVNSKTLTNLKTDYTHGYDDSSNNIIGTFKYSVPSTIDTYNLAPFVIFNNNNKTRNLFSRKVDIQTFDIYFTDDDDKVVNLNGSNVSLQLVMLT